jgi:hypothetical protein
MAAVLLAVVGITTGVVGVLRQPSSFRRVLAAAPAFAQAGSAEALFALAQSADRAGRDAEARQTLEDYVANPVLRSHAGYLAEYLSKKGHPDLATRIQTKDLFRG